MIEEWKDIKGYKGLYQVSNLGNIKSLERFKQNHNKEQLVKERMLKHGINHKGYYYVVLFKCGIQKSCLVHKLVAEAFIPNPNNFPQINHKSGIKSDNSISNLEWCTQSGNMQHALKQGLKPTKKVNQYDKQGNLIKEWDSIREAARKLNIPNQSIVRCCKRKRPTAYNYIWKYKEDIA